MPSSSELISDLQPVRAAVHAHSGLKLLVLHGSRAREDAREDSDWDFAYLAAPEVDIALLYADLAVALRSDRIDLADLAAVGGLIRYRAARDGVMVFESEPGTFDRFWFESVSFWCDAGPVLRAGYRALLDELGA